MTHWRAAWRLKMKPTRKMAPKRPSRLQMDGTEWKKEGMILPQNELKVSSSWGERQGQELRGNMAGRQIWGGKGMLRPLGLGPERKKWGRDGVVLFAFVEYFFVEEADESVDAFLEGEAGGVEAEGGVLGGFEGG